jgi:DNA-binding NtrC family response regulator
VRELKNMLKKAVIMSETESVDEIIHQSLAAGADNCTRLPMHPRKGSGLSDQLRALEKELIKNARRRCKTTREMARVLKISQPSVVRKLKKYQLDRDLIQK